MQRSLSRALIGLCLLCGCAGRGVDLSTEAKAGLMLQSSADPSSHLHVLHRRGGDAAGPPVVIVHGLSYPGALFDVPVNGSSFVDTLAATGVEVYVPDLRGYGRSTRPAFMAKDPGDSAPSLGQMSDALQDLDDVVEFVRQRHGTDKVDLIGYSWGAARAANFAALHPGKLRRLVLIAPVNRPTHTAVVSMSADPNHPGRLNPALGGYRVVAAQELRKEWDRQIGAGNPAAFRDEAVVAAATRALLASDPEMGGGSFRAPLGPMLDAFLVRQGRPLFDPGRVTVPTLVVRGQQDLLSSQEDAWAIFEGLATPDKRIVTLAGATHFLFLEKRAHELSAQIRLFLRE